MGMSTNELGMMKIEIDVSIIELQHELTALKKRIKEWEHWNYLNVMSKEEPE